VRGWRALHAARLQVDGPLHYCYSPATAMRRLQGPTLARNALLRGLGAENLVTVAADDWHAFKPGTASSGAATSSDGGDEAVDQPAPGEVGGSKEPPAPPASKRAAAKRGGSAGADAAGEPWKEQAKSWLRGLLDAAVASPASPQATAPSLTSSSAASKAIDTGTGPGPHGPEAVQHQVDQASDAADDLAAAKGEEVATCTEPSLGLTCDQDNGRGSEVKTGGPGALPGPSEQSGSVARPSTPWLLRLRGAFGSTR
jgi:hypothetical protein